MYDRLIPSQLAAVTAIPGVIFFGSLDGKLRAYGSQAGKIVWLQPIRKKRR